MAAEQLCPGPCNTAYLRERTAYDQAMAIYDPLDSAQSRPEPPDIQSATGNPWCSRCKSIIRWQFSQLDRLASLRVSVLLSDGFAANAAAERVSGSIAEIGRAHV